MIYKETITLWNAVRPHPTVDATNGTSVILNTNRINNYKVRATTKSKFYYSINPWDRRESPGYLETESSNSTITNAFNSTYNSNIFAMPVFENDDTTTAVVTRNIAWEDFAYAIADPNSSTRSYVWYTKKGAGLVRVLVDYSLDQIIDIAGSGATTTTSTTSGA